MPERAVAAPLPEPAAADLAFERHEVVTGHGEHQTVLVGALLGGPAADLAVVDVVRSGERRLRIYALGDSGWAPLLDATLAPGVLFVDLAEIAGRERLIAYERGRLSWFDPDAASLRTLAEVATSFRAVDERDVPHVDVTRDLNRDGRDDLLLPDVDGFWVATQAGDGSFSDPVKLGTPVPSSWRAVGSPEAGAADPPPTGVEAEITAATVPLHLSRVHRLDWDLDGRSDVAFWNRDHFDVHRQDERGRFEPAPTAFTVGVPFDSEGAYSRALDYRDAGFLSLVFGCGRKTERTVLHALRDVDGDRVADLVTLRMSGRSITRQRSVYEVHFGAATPDGVSFARDAGATIRPRGRGGAMEPWGYSSRRLEDLDGDGKLDMMSSDVRVGIGGMLRALVGNSVPLDVELYRMQGGAYPDRPTVARRIRRFAPFAGLGNVFFPPVLVGDVNGDGRSDLLVGRSPETLHVHLGVQGPEMLARQPLRVAVSLPPDERNTWLVDLDRDGKQDVVVRHGPTGRAPRAPQRLTTLIAR